MLVLFISLIAELNRIPFDFIEGESELVSGFNVEYMRVRFTFIFLAEYIIILVVGIFFIIIFYGSSLFYFINLLYVIIFGILMILIRGSLPRIRYDNLMYFC